MPVLKESVLAIRELAGLGTREAYAAAKLSQRVQLSNMLDWKAFGSRSRQGLIKDLTKVRGNPLQIDEDDDRSIVLGGIHAGSLPLAVAWISSNCFPGWPLVIIKRAAGDDDEIKAQMRLNELGVRTTILTHDRSAGQRDVFRQARLRTLILCMVDLPPAYGKPRSAQIFWKDARLAAGAIEVARMCRARLLLFSSSSIGHHEIVRTHGPIDMGTDTGQFMDYDRLIDDWITFELLRDPGQWHNWDRVDEYHVRVKP